MKKKKFLIIFVIIIILVGILLLGNGGVRTDVYLKDYEVSNDGKNITLKVGILESSGYIRTMKKTSGSMNYYLTFYSTFGINSKLGSNDTFTIEIDENVDEIYFYQGDKGYNKVLEKNENSIWVRVTELTNSNIKNIVDKTKNIKDFACDTALDKFYEDECYSYYYSCIKGDYIVVEYNDGTEETVKQALENNKIKISDLDVYDILYIKYERINN